MTKTVPSAFVASRIANIAAGIRGNNLKFNLSGDDPKSKTPRMMEEESDFTKRQKQIIRQAS